MPRAGLTQQSVVEHAAALADDVGLSQLTLAALAQRLGVALPSLYKHIRGYDSLIQKIACVSTAQLATELADAAAGRSGYDALRAVALAYRDYAHRQPGRYAASQRAPEPTDPQHVTAAARAVDTIFAVLRHYQLTEDDAIDATRVLRSALHGFVSLEREGGFGLPRDLDGSYEQLIASLHVALCDWPNRHASPNQT